VKKSLEELENEFKTNKEEIYWAYKKFKHKTKLKMFHAHDVDKLIGVDC